MIIRHPQTVTGIYSLDVIHARLKYRMLDGIRFVKLVRNTRGSWEGTSRRLCYIVRPNEFPVFEEGKVFVIEYRASASKRAYHPGGTCFLPTNWAGYRRKLVEINGKSVDPVGDAAKKRKKGGA